MNKQQIEAIAHTILSMTTEERQLLDRILSQAEASQPSEPETKTQRIAAIAQDIQDFETEYRNAYKPPVQDTSDDLLTLIQTMPLENL